MKHARPISRMSGPAPAQFGGILDIFTVISTLLSLYGAIIEAFFPEKSGEGGGEEA